MVLLNNTQPSFSSGILSTELFSRIDYNKLASGLRQCENWIVRPAGGLSFRAGTEYLAEVKDSTKKTILIPFSLSQGNSYCLEFGNNYIRFYKGSTQITSGGVPYEIATTYTTDELSDIKYVQHKNKMFLVHKNHAPAVLTMTGDTNWSLTTMVFNPTVPSVTNLTLTVDNPKQSGTVVLYDKWQYAVSVVDSDDNEGFAVKSSVVSGDIDLLNQPINVSFTAPTGAAAGYRFNIYRIYRGEFYLIYTLPFVVGTTTYSLKDISFQPDTTKSIKVEFDAFSNSNYPSAVGIWNQRLVFGNTPKGPNTLYGSRVGVFDDFTTTILNNADESFELELNASDNDYITDIIPLDDMIVMTQSRIWRVTGNSAANMNAYIESYSGSSGLRPFSYKKSILYIDSSFNTVSNFVYSYELNGYVGQNLDILCRDMFDGYTLTDMTFLNSPFGILYTVRNDGVLLGLTYLREENIYAWHKHTTDGQFEAVCALDNAKNDDLYVIVKRGDKRYVELFHRWINETEDSKDSWHLDCASRFVSNWSLYSRTATTTVTTAYNGYRSNESSSWKCWREEKPRRYKYQPTVWIATGKYFYTRSTEATISNDNAYATENRSKTNQSAKLLRATLDPTYSYKPGTFCRYVYDSSGDFSETFTGSAWVVDNPVTVGSYAYDYVNNEWVYLGTVYSISGSNLIISNHTYTRNSTLDKTETTTTTTTINRYVEGTPTVGGNAYNSVDKTETYTIDAVGTDYITIGDYNYALIDSSEASLKTITGLTRFNNKTVSALCDGSEYVDLEVDSGTVTLPKEFSTVLIGLPYTGIVEPIPVDIKFNSGSSSVGVNRRICKANIRYYRSRGLWYGTALDKLYQIKTYTQYNLGEEIPLESLNLNLEVSDVYQRESSFFVVQKSPVPALLQSVTLEMEYGDKN